MSDILDSGERRTFTTGVELWKACAGYEGLYEVSNVGRVRSLRRKTRIADKESNVMKLKTDDHGYYRVNLHKDGKCKGELVSRLVAQTFIPNPCNLPHVGHDDDNKKNNTVDNLYWTDAKENNNHNGKMERFQKLHREKIGQIADALSKPVICIDRSTKEMRFYKSMQEAARIEGADSGKISMCCLGLRKSHRNKEWRYAVNG